MAGFSVVEHPIRTIWCPVGYTTTATPYTLYVGQLVKLSAAGAASGAVPFAQGAAPTTGIPFGVVVGNNNKEPVFDATYKAEYITSVNTQADLLARKWAGIGMTGGGMWVPSDPMAMVKVDLIGPDTVLKGRIFAGTYGVAPTVGTVSATSGTGLTYTCAVAGLGVTRIAYNSTHYCRTGANQGLYRVSYDTGTTLQATTFYIPMPQDIVVGDTFVCVNAALGHTLLTFDALGTYIDGQAAQTYNNMVNVIDIDLRNAGEEYCLFNFGNPWIA